MKKTIFIIIFSLFFISNTEFAAAQGLRGTLVNSQTKNKKVKNNNIEELQQKAISGNAFAQRLLGEMYLNGDGVAQDYKEAVKWFQLSAALGNPDAQALLGIMYYKGEGVAQSDKESFKWTKLSAEQGNVGAQSYLGRMYSSGVGVSQDYEKAYMWTSIASARGDRSARKGLDLLSKAMTSEKIAEAQRLSREWKSKTWEELEKILDLSNTKTPIETSIEDPIVASLLQKIELGDENAFEELREQAEKGNAEAQYTLGEMYYYGIIVPKDYIQAYLWLNLAAAQGQGKARKLLDLLLKIMTPEQIEEAQELLNEWQPET